MLPDKDKSGEVTLERAMATVKGAARFEGADLRGLRLLPQNRWGELKIRVTPEGHHPWLCDFHAQEYIMHSREAVFAT